MRLGILRSWPCWELRFEILLSAALLCADLGVVAQSTPPTPGAQSQQDSASKADKAENADKADKKDDRSSGPAMTKLRIRVLNDQDKPVVNASVYVRFYTAGGLLHHEKLAEMNFKTNHDGLVKVPDVPQGKILIQVIATGWHTYGKWYEVEKEEESIDIKLVPPTHWY